MRCYIPLDPYPVAITDTHFLHHVFSVSCILSSFFFYFYFYFHFFLPLQSMDSLRTMQQIRFLFDSIYHKEKLNNSFVSETLWKMLCNKRIERREWWMVNGERRHWRILSIQTKAAHLIMCIRLFGVSFRLLTKNETRGQEHSNNKGQCIPVMAHRHKPKKTSKDVHEM